MTDKLRDEIIESQKGRTDLMKWKLILVAAIGAAGLGMGPNAALCGHPVILLVLIPFVCLYVDVVCFHNDLRIMAIAQFLRKQTRDLMMKEYETHCMKKRSYFSLEDFALVVATVFLSVLVFAIGRSKVLQDFIGVRLDSAGKVFMWSGGIGLVASLLLFGFYRYKRYRIGHS